MSDPAETQIATVIVKGTPKDFYREARDRGLCQSRVKTHLHYTELSACVIGEDLERLLAKWFTREIQAPFPAGTLLWYRIHKEGEDPKHRTGHDALALDHDVVHE